LHVVELDETVVRLTREHIQERRGQFPTNWSLTIDDGKHFLGNYHGPPFDVISIDVPMPAFLQTAMLHSDRFFALARTRLAPGGIFSVSLCGTYSAQKPGGRPGAASLSNRVMAGLLKNFRHVIVLHSDDRDFAWASDAPIPFAAEELRARATEFVKETRTLNYFGAIEIELRDPKEVRSWAEDHAPIGEADMQIVLQLSIDKLMNSYYGESE
jgi:spermidine synthase